MGALLIILLLGHSLSTIGFLPHSVSRHCFQPLFLTQPPKEASEASIRAQQDAQYQRFQQQRSQLRSLTDPDPLTSLPLQSIQYAPPLKAMLFIDGTWLYYSIYRRSRDGNHPHRCPIANRFGPGWAFSHRVRWEEIPRIVEREIAKETGRSVEVVRSNVFTSMKKETEVNSARHRMFDDMESLNFDVDQMVTEGQAEKCVDIKLAVEMLHYATVPDAYDIAVVVTGDKDFMPALKRTRQKGKRVALASMMPGCNRALLDVKNRVKDFKTIWLEEHLDILIEELGINRGAKGAMSAATILKVVISFLSTPQIKNNPVNSRDIGRHLKSISLGGSTLLHQVKITHGGIRHFFNTHNDFFEVVGGGEEDSDASNAFWLSLRGGREEVMSRLEAMATKCMMSEVEGNFYFPYKYKFDTDDFLYTTNSIGGDEDWHSSAYVKGDESVTVETLSKKTLNELKKNCRELLLPVSGTKQKVISRLVEYYDERAAIVNKSNDGSPLIEADPIAIAYLKNAVVRYLAEQDGVSAGSRNIGRHLQTLPASPSADDNTNVTNALQELKLHFGNLRNFLVEGILGDEYEEGEFRAQEGFLVTKRQ